jgi:hypothetical protein
MLVGSATRDASKRCTRAFGGWLGVLRSACRDLLLGEQLALRLDPEKEVVPYRLSLRLPLQIGQEPNVVVGYASGNTRRWSAFSFLDAMCWD